MQEPITIVNTFLNDFWEQIGSTKTQHVIHARPHRLNFGHGWELVGWPARRYSEIIRQSSEMYPNN